MKKMISFFKDEDGGQAIEYGLIAALIGVAIIVGTALLGTNLNAMFTNIGAKVGGVVVP